MQINDITIAVHHSWESFPNVYSVVRCFGGSKSGTVTSASSSWAHTLQSDNSEFSLDRESSDSWLASALFLAGSLLCFLVEVATQLLWKPKVVKCSRTWWADPCDALRGRVRNTWPKVTKQTQATKNNTHNSIQAETICKLFWPSLDAMKLTPQPESRGCNQALHNKIWYLRRCQRVVTVWKALHYISDITFLCNLNCVVIQLDNVIAIVID